MKIKTSHYSLPVFFSYSMNLLNEVKKKPLQQMKKYENLILSVLVKSRKTKYTCQKSAIGIPINQKF